MSEMRGSTRAKVFCLFYVIVAASFVYCRANREILTNPYLVNNDVHQQVYWMQRWIDPGLFQDDLPSRYARAYVPWGVQSVYRLTCRLVNPVVFSNYLTGILYVISVGFFFGLGMQFRDERTAVLVATSFFCLPRFLVRWPGAYPEHSWSLVWAAYLYFLAEGRLFAASVVIFLEALFNPYVFLICLMTHGLYMAHTFGWGIICRVVAGIDRYAPGLGRGGLLGRLVKYLPGRWQRLPAPVRSTRLQDLLLLNVPVVLAMAVTILQFVVLRPPDLGGLVGWTDMVGKAEYTAAGRFRTGTNSFAS